MIPGGDHEVGDLALGHPKRIICEWERSWREYGVCHVCGSRLKPGLCFQVNSYMLISICCHLKIVRPRWTPFRETQGSVRNRCSNHHHCSTNPSLWTLSPILHLGIGYPFLRPCAHSEYTQTRRSWALPNNSEECHPVCCLQCIL